MTSYRPRAGLRVADTLPAFIEQRVLPGTGIAPEAFWWGAAAKIGADNAGNPLHRAMSEAPGERIAFQTARALVFEAVRQPNGYTEPLLHRFPERVTAGEGA